MFCNALRDLQCGETVNRFLLLIQIKIHFCAYTYACTHVHEKIHPYQANKKTMINYVDYFYND